jgi:hypothetical protein
MQQRRGTVSTVYPGSTAGPDDVIRTMTQEEELRYEPEMPPLPHVEKLWATLDEIARKVKEAVGGQPVPPERLPPPR